MSTDPLLLEALQRSLSLPRLRRYLEAANGDMATAIALYEWNTRIAEALYTPLQDLEISLRNRLDQAMSRVFGLDWLTQANSGLSEFARTRLKEAVAAHPSATRDDLVAEMKFAFWVSLLGPSYDATLWRRALHTCFEGRRGLRRSVIHGRLNAVRRFRNRVAHHEPIFERAKQMHGEIIEALAWIAPDTLAWTRRRCRFAEEFGIGEQNIWPRTL